ncbi:hypothetical protein fugu_014944 [Takifugu bimaculatus]|uniref:Ig-like domain-containing protein n=1 Tax=Takifugu bimaculatus TaxID=433685 RepID=A0A4Z2BYG4_9TELE|nr:hypothetical protein fugu_014944 [Takifugu bimaculatus]
MLESLCTLITALTCVSAVTVLTQKPTVVSLSRGESVTMDCNLGTVTDASAARWYKQVPGRVPHDDGDDDDGDDDSDDGDNDDDDGVDDDGDADGDDGDEIGDNDNDDGDDDVDDDGDDDDGTKLIVTSSSLPPPVLTVFPPSRAELQSNKATLVCLSRLSAPFAEVSWLLGDTSVSSGISTSTPVQQADQTFQISSHLSILTSDWDAQKVYTCKVSVGSQTAEKSLKKSECEE